MMILRRILIACLLAAPSLAPATAQSLKSDEVYSSIEARALSSPNPVTGSDGLIHLAYELQVVNNSHLFITLDRVEVIEAAGKVLDSMDGEALGVMTRSYASSSRQLPPGGVAVVYVDVALEKAAKIPARLSARLTASRQVAGADGKAAGYSADQPIPEMFTFDGAPVSVGPPAVVIEAPLRGPRWVVFNGCCDSVTSHRGAVMAVNGEPRVPERFAIDFIRLDAEGRLFQGDISKLGSYPYYGDNIHAVGHGVVVNVYDDTDEQVPGLPAKGITTESIGGNMLVIDMGGGQFAFYAHMQRGSLKVGLGDRVKAGDVIGLLGNTGNSDAPHLHFHVMDGPSPLNANGLPYQFARFAVQGVLGQDSGVDAGFDKGTPMKIDGSSLDGQHTNELPLNNQVIDFD